MVPGDPAGKDWEWVRQACQEAAVGSRDVLRVWGGFLSHSVCSPHPSGGGAGKIGELAGLYAAGAWWYSSLTNTRPDLSLEAKTNVVIQR